MVSVRGLVVADFSLICVASISCFDVTVGVHVAVSSFASPVMEGATCACVCVCVFVCVCLCVFVCVCLCVQCDVSRLPQAEADALYANMMVFSVGPPKLRKY